MSNAATETRRNRRPSFPQREYGAPVAVECLAVGDQIIERDGAMLTIAAIELGATEITVRFERYGCGPAPVATRERGVCLYRFTGGES